MSNPSNFRSTLERLVLELGAAHDSEVAALQEQVTQVHGVEPELSVTPVPALVHAGDAFTPRSAASPRESSDEYNAAVWTHEGGNGLLTTPRRQQSMTHTSEQPPQPKLCIDQMSWEFGDNTEQERLVRDQSMYSTKTEDTLDSILADLPAEFMDNLRLQFDRLDIDGEDKIPIERFLDMVKTFSEEPMELDALARTVKRLHASRQPEENSVTGKLTHAVSRYQCNVDKYLYFEDFAYLMAYGDLVPPQQTVSKKLSEDVVHKFRDAIKMFDNHQSQLIRTAEETRARHNRLAFFLDVVPAPVILLNSLVLGLRADIAPDSSVWRVADFLFLSFYISEALVKFRLFGCRVYWCGPGAWWNIFDFACILVSVVDIILKYLVPGITGSDSGAQVGELMLMKMLRLAKLGRLLRVLPSHVFAELKAMIFGVVSGVRVILWAIVMLLVCIFFLGAVMNNLVGGYREEFETVPSSMFTVFRCFTDGCAAYDGTPLTEHLRKEYGSVFITGYTLAYMFVTVGVFNLIMATFIENVVSTTQSRKQEELGEKTESTRMALEQIFLKLITSDKVHYKTCLSVHLVPRHMKKDVRKHMKHSVSGAFRLLPADLAIGKPVFAEWLEDREFIKVLHDADIDTSNSKELFDVLDADLSKELTLKELVDGLMRLRGPITKSDMISVRMQVQLITQLVQSISGVQLITHPSSPVSPKGPLSPYSLHMEGRTLTRDLRTSSRKSAVQSSNISLESSVSRYSMNAESNQAEVHFAEGNEVQG